MAETAEEVYEVAVHHLNMGDRVTANAKFEETLLLNPRHSKAFAQRGAILAQNGSFFDAAINYDRAIDIEPAAAYFNNKGTALIELKQWDQATQCFYDAIKHKPDFDSAWNNLARLYLVRGQLDKARKSFDMAINLNQNNVEAHIGLAFLNLEEGKFEAGWKEYEWRRRKLPDRGLPLKEWRGEKLADDEGILLCSEQGLGDVIQFCRYAPLIKLLYGGKVYIEVRPPLTRLINTLTGIDGVIAYGDALPPGVKYFAMMLSCPLIFGHFEEGHLPRAGAYLSALPDRVASFVSFVKMLSEGLPVVGACWAGNSGLATDRRRSTNLSMWAPLSTAPVGWISLQKGRAAEQLRTTQNGMTILDVIGECDDLSDTAALIMHCDLVISVDTAIAHLAAALGKPTWVLSRRDACWRWLGDRQDSPWYPTVRHFRQKSFDDWPSLMLEVAGELRDWAAMRQATRQNSSALEELLDNITVPALQT